MSGYDEFLGTRPVADAHRFDIGALERYLSTLEKKGLVKNR